MNEFILIIIALFTSSITAVFGLGGGLILIAFMPGLLPPAAIIPVHGVAQLASNISRAAFSYKEIHWEFALAFFIGAVAGGLLAAQIALLINLNYIPYFIAAFILVNVWGPPLEFRENPRGEFITIGFLQTATGMLVGATGPLGQSTLLRKGLARDALVATSALFMAINHLLKVVIFSFIGFSFVQYWPLCLGMMLSVVIGSYIGTLMRQRVPSEKFHIILKLLLTALALRMIVNTSINQSL